MVVEMEKRHFITLRTTIEFHPHGYAAMPIHWYKPNVPRCDWWVKYMINNSVAVFVSIKLLYK